MKEEYSFCESIHASNLSPWHIRQLTDAGLKLGGGIDTPSLCGRVRVGLGWDLSVPLDDIAVKWAPDFICRECAAALMAALAMEVHKQEDG